MQRSPGMILGSLTSPLHHSIAWGERCGAWDHGCTTVSQWNHGTALWLNLDLHCLLWKWAPGSLHGALFLLFIPTYPRLSRFLPNKDTHRPLASIKGQYKHPTLPLRSLFLTLLLNSNQSVNWVKNNHTEQKNDLLPPSASYAFATSLIRHWKEKSNDFWMQFHRHYDCDHISMFAVVMQGQRKIIQCVHTCVCVLCKYAFHHFPWVKHARNQEGEDV